jgi:hypothetical protein
VLEVLGTGAVGLLFAGLLARSAALLPWSVGLLGSCAAIAMLAGGQPAERVAPLYGSGLLLTAELAWWALDRVRTPAASAGLARHRALLLAAMVAAGAVLSLLVLLAAGLAQATTGLEIRVLGTVAAVMVAWIVAGLVRRAGSSG